MPSRIAVIIGGGLGGLATAIRLAVAGWNVTVCERGNTFGGKMNIWEDKGYKFDTGPSLITMPWVFGDLYKVAGSKLEDHLEMVQMNPLAHYNFDDGTQFTYTSSLPDWLKTIEQLEKQDADGFLKFIKLGAQLYGVSRNTFLRRCPSDFFQAADLSSLSHMPLRYGWGNYAKTVDTFFKCPYLRQLYNRYPTYVGSSPYLSPATLAVIPYIEYAFNGWYVKGGLYRIVESLIELARNLKVTLLNNACVTNIEADNKKIKAVRLANGDKLIADVVIANGDASEVQSLVDGNSNRKILQTERSMSGFVMLLGIKRNLPELKHHSIYFSANYPKEFSQLFDERRFPDDPTVYVNAPSRTDRTIVPAEGEALFIMANAPANDVGQWNVKMIELARQRVFSRLRRSGFPDIEEDIEVFDVWTPDRIATSYLMPGGAIYGTHSHGWRRAFLRPPNKDKQYQGLYYVGGSTHPGGGTPTVLISAQITSELIQRYEYT